MEPKDWIAAAALIFTVVNTLALYVVNSSKVTKSDVKSHGDRLTKLEVDVSNLPSKNEFHKLEVMVTGIVGQQNLLNERLSTIGLQVGRIEEFLIDQAKARTRETAEASPSPRRRKA